MKFFIWFAGFFEDVVGNASSKRAALYFSLYFYYLLVKGSLKGEPIDQMVLFSTLGIILFSIGAVSSEFFNKFTPTKVEQTKVETSEKTSTISETK